MRNQTLYQRATVEIQKIIRDLLDLSERTHNFSAPPDGIWDEDRTSAFLLGGIGYPVSQLPPPGRRKNAWLARSAMVFSLEHACTGKLYEVLQPFIDKMIDKAFKETGNFSHVTPEWIHGNAHLLPVMMHASGTFSKRELIRLVGTVSDTGISKSASVRISKFLGSVDSSVIPSQRNVRERIKSTTEGIVRDLVGRLLLEEFVASALNKAGVPFRRETEYEALTGVVYGFRADFVVPDEKNPRAFIEVRKSSSSHASLYAKDKMFSAINWKGLHRKCLGILIVDGPWSGETLDILSRVFDYVVPIRNSAEVARVIRLYLDGDDKLLRWLINFQIEQNPQ